MGAKLGKLGAPRDEYLYLRSTEAVDAWGPCLEKCKRKTRDSLWTLLEEQYGIESLQALSQDPKYAFYKRITLDADLVKELYDTAPVSFPCVFCFF